MKEYRRNMRIRIFIPMVISFLPSLFVPLVGLVFPAVAMASLFLYIERDEIA
jgi:photosystem I subunit 8